MRMFFLEDMFGPVNPDGIKFVNLEHALKAVKRRARRQDRVFRMTTHGEKTEWIVQPTGRVVWRGP